jgi:hypothetical protein
VSPERVPRFGIVTGEQAPQLTADGQALKSELQERGYAAEPVVWTKRHVSWSTFDAVLVRSCWQYYRRPAAFRELLSRLDEAGVTVINVVPIPKSSSEAHIRENFAAQELDLDDEGVARTDAIDRRERQVDFPAAPWN